MSSKLKDANKQKYFWIQTSSMVDWDKLLNKLEIKTSGKIDIQDSFLESINLYQNLPLGILEYPAPLIFTVDKMSDIQGNNKWIIDRNNPNDLVIDSHGLLRYLSEVEKEEPEPEKVSSIDNLISQATAISEQSKGLAEDLRNRLKYEELLND